MKWKIFILIILLFFIVFSIIGYIGYSFKYNLNSNTEEIKIIDDVKEYLIDCNSKPLLSCDDLLLEKLELEN